MAYIVMAYIVMATHLCLYSHSVPLHGQVFHRRMRAWRNAAGRYCYGLYSYGRYSYDLCSYGLHSYGPAQHSRLRIPRSWAAHTPARISTCGPLRLCMHELAHRLLRFSAAHTTITGSPHHYYYAFALLCTRVYAHVHTQGRYYRTWPAPRRRAPGPRARAMPYATSRRWASRPRWPTAGDTIYNVLGMAYPVMAMSKMAAAVLASTCYRYN